MAKRYSAFSLAIGLMLFCGACSQQGMENADKRNEQNQEKGSTDKGLVAVIKSGKLANFQSTTIGNAFDTYKYLTKKEWKQEQLKSGHITVDFIGWFESRSLDEKARQGGVKDRGLEVTFVINPDGSYYLYMISVLDSGSDGKVHRDRVLDTSAVLENIYSNKKISL